MRLWIAAAALAALLSCSRHAVVLDVQAPATLAGEPAGGERAVVTRVIDGDTIEVEIVARIPGAGAGRARPGRTYPVRLLGIDTPESVAPGEPVECFGPEASAAADALLAGAAVTLVRDVEERDRYGRLLRYVYVGAEMANARLVANGYARAWAYPPNVRNAGLLGDLEEAARARGSGLWSPAACAGGAAP